MLAAPKYVVHAWITQATRTRERGIWRGRSPRARIRSESARRDNERQKAVMAGSIQDSCVHLPTLSTRALHPTGRARSARVRPCY